MDLDFTPEQELLRETVRGLCARHSGLDVVRQLEDDPVGYPEKLWLQLGELGLLDLAELSMLDAAIVYQELGRALAPSPHFVSSVLSAGVLRRAGSDWLPRVTSGEAIVTPAWLEPSRGAGPEGVQIDATRLVGTKRHVHYAAAADRLLVLARDGDEVVFVLVDPKGPGVTLLSLRQDAAFAEIKGPFAHGSWSGPVEQAPQQLRGWLGVRDKLIAAQNQRIVRYIAGKETFLFRF